MASLLTCSSAARLLGRGRGVIETRVRGEDDIEGVVLSGNLSGARANLAGFVFEDGGGTYDPPWSAVPGGEYQVGKRLQGRSIRTDRSGRKSWIDNETRTGVTRSSW